MHIADNETWESRTQSCGFRATCPELALNEGPSAHAAGPVLLVGSLCFSGSSRAVPAAQSPLTWACPHPGTGTWRAILAPRRMVKWQQLRTGLPRRNPSPTSPVHPRGPEQTSCALNLRVCFLEHCALRRVQQNPASYLWVRAHFIRESSWKTSSVRKISVKCSAYRP